jgi:RluA family pseudouridine synthase
LNLTPCPILHEDSSLLIIDKPTGLLSHPNSRTRQEPCAFLGDFDVDERTFKQGKQRVWLIHRLDQDTSGVLLAAKTEKAAEALRQAFADHAVTKTYCALVASSGGLKPKGQWLDHLATAPAGRKVRTVVRPGARPNAELHYTAGDYSTEHRVTQIEIDLITGRTHQIRVQAAHRRHPVVGDDVYGDFALNRSLRSVLGTRRLFLHARRLTLKHPKTGAVLRVEAPFDSAWQAGIAALHLA